MSQSKVQRWLYGDELAKRWNASPLDIWALMCEGKLIPYNIVTFHRVYVSNNPEIWMQSGKKPEEIRHDIASLGFRLEDIELVEKETNPPEMGNQVGEIKLRPNQRHKEACRAKAKEIWEVSPGITIEDMIQHDEINEIFDGRVYGEKTIRNWIKDLCPNRKPGRRPKAKAE
jgi:hypothetical protein